MPSFSDLIDGPKMFQNTFGQKWGPRLWWAFFSVVVLAIGVVALSQIGGVGKSAYSEIKGWFSPTSSQPPLAGTVPPSSGSCIVSGGENRGKIIQNCK